MRHDQHCLSTFVPPGFAGRRWQDRDRQAWLIWFLCDGLGCEWQAVSVAGTDQKTSGCFLASQALHEAPGVTQLQPLALQPHLLRPPGPALPPQRPHLEAPLAAPPPPPDAMRSPRITSPSVKAGAPGQAVASGHWGGACAAAEPRNEARARPLAVAPPEPEAPKARTLPAAGLSPGYSSTAGAGAAPPAPPVQPAGLPTDGRQGDGRPSRSDPAAALGDLADAIHADMCRAQPPSMTEPATRCSGAARRTQTMAGPFLPLAFCLPPTFCSAQTMAGPVPMALLGELSAAPMLLLGTWECFHSSQLSGCLCSLDLLQRPGRRISSRIGLCAIVTQDRMLRCALVVCRQLFGDAPRVAAASEAQGSMQYQVRRRACQDLCSLDQTAISYFLEEKQDAGRFQAIPGSRAMPIFLAHFVN
jgi:hypothetical protein